MPTESRWGGGKAREKHILSTFACTLFADVGALRGADVLHAESSDPLSFDGLALRRADGALRVMLANMTPNTQKVTVRGLRGRGRVKRLDQTSVRDAVCDMKKFKAWPGTEYEAGGGMELELLPFAILRIDEIDREEG